MARSRREHLVDTALELFSREGYHATGIDKILAEAGVAKMTLYNHFKSKDELILAALRRRDEQFRNWFMRDVERRGQSPRERLLAVFDTLGAWFDRPTFNGCSFINASAEFGSPDDPIHGACAEHQHLVLGYLTELAKSAGAKDPEGLAEGLLLLMEGAIVLRHVACRRDAAKTARATASVLVDQALG